MCICTHAHVDVRLSTNIPEREPPDEWRQRNVGLLDSTPAAIYRCRNTQIRGLRRCSTVRVSGTAKFQGGLHG